MRIVVQRVKKASVSVGGIVIGEIESGLFVLVGITNGDTKEDANILVDKLTKLRIISDTNGKMNLSLMDTKSSLLVVSQFTLYADTRNGNRPSFVGAADPPTAEKIYQHFVDKLSEYDINVRTGKFGEYMEIEAILDGPVTILIDS